MKIKTKVLIIFFHLPLFLIAQKKLERSVLEKKIISNTNNYIVRQDFKKARTFFLEKKWDSVLKYTYKEINNISTENDLEVKNYCHFLRGYSFKRKKVFNEAKEEFLKITDGFIFDYYVKMFLGEIATELNDFKKALSYFKQLELLNSSHDLGFYKGAIETNIGTCYIHLEAYDKAEVYLLKGLKIQEAEKDKMQLIGTYGNIANFYYNQYKDNQAIPYFEKAFSLSKSLNIKSVRSFDLKKEAARNMSIVEENRKDFQKALTYRKEFEQWNDSLNNQNRIWETARREKLDAIKEKQKQVILLEADNKTKIAERNGYLYSSIILLFLLGTGTYFYREKVKANKTIAAQKETLNEINATKDYLFSVVSHDLRSPVNTLRKQHKKLKDQIDTNDYKGLEKTIDTSTRISESIYGLLNNILHWSLEQSKQLLFLPKTMALHPTVEHVVFDFKDLAAAKNISLHTNLDQSILASFDTESLKVVLRNLLDNAIKYTPESGTIEINTSSTATDVCIKIKDTGVGFSSDQIARINELTIITMEKIDRSKGVGLGLLLCVTLIRKNKGNFTILNNSDKGSTLKITLPKA